jgi:hypothetical protein
MLHSYNVKPEYLVDHNGIRTAPLVLLKIEDYEERKIKLFLNVPRNKSRFFHSRLSPVSSGITLSFLTL